MAIQPIFNVRNLTLVNGGHVPPFDLGGGIGGPPDEPNGPHPYRYWPFVSITKHVPRTTPEGASKWDYCFWDVKPSDGDRENWAIARQCAEWLGARLGFDEEPLRDSSIFAKIVEDQMREAHDPRHRKVIDAFWTMFGEEVERLAYKSRGAD